MATSSMQATTVTATHPAASAPAAPEPKPLPAILSNFSLLLKALASAALSPLASTVSLAACVPLSDHCVLAASFASLNLSDTNPRASRCHGLLHLSALRDLGASQPEYAEARALPDLPVDKVIGRMHRYQVCTDAAVVLAVVYIARLLESYWRAGYAEDALRVLGPDSIDVLLVV
eukprot:TRINITY_DN65_c0_g1_i1.p1 TRINITY_DN65_c0_g1~~TRINITY_DN65_c0_g1_i1.p1  ORF type:complete len:188 (-),score=36.08 TRINITY_DN65_c0_g1_i1:483-1007(-)